VMVGYGDDGERGQMGVGDECRWGWLGMGTNLTRTDGYGDKYPSPCSSVSQHVVCLCGDP